MTHDPRPHIHRRGRAIGRLRSLTTGAAIAGVAGTAGFALIAAASWSGDQNATAAGGSTTTDTVPADGATGTQPGVAPNTRGTVPRPVAQPPTTTTPRVQRGSGTGHAATGGSH